MPLTLPFPSFFTESGGPQPASQLDSNFAAVNTSLTTEQPITAATTTDLGSVQSNNVVVNFSSSPTVSAFGSSAVTTQPFYNVRWAGTGTATLQNSSSILIAGGQNLVINPNDQGKAIYLGGGNWSYAPTGSGKTFPGASSTLASATTTDLGTATSFLVNITGTTTITSFGSSALTTAPLYFLTFAGALLLTYNATSLIMPTSANITTAAGDSAVAQYLGSGNWAIIDYQRKSGAALVGANSNYIKHVTNLYTTNSSTTNTIPFTTAIPTTANGAVAFSQAITPSNSANKLIVEVKLQLSSTNNDFGGFLVVGAGTNAVSGALLDNPSAANHLWSCSFMYEMTAGTTSPITFTVYYGGAGGTVYINGNSSGQIWGGGLMSSIIITEVMT